MFTAWIPVIIVAILLSVGIVIGYYLLGVLLNNGRMRSAAMAEFANALATALVIVALLIIFNFFGSATSNPILSAVPSSTISTICTQLQTANVIFVNSNSSSNSPTSQVCSALVQNAQSTGATATLDYGLTATYVITANLTEQAAENLNAAYVFNGYMNFLQSFAARDIVCFPTDDCLLTYGPTSRYINASVKPFAGYIGIYKSLNLVTTQSTLIFTVFMFQLIAMLTFMFLWPYLLAAGLILRVTLFTRRLGGLLIAIVVVVMLIYPAIFLIEYTALSNAGIQPIGANTFGTNAIPVLTIGSLSPGVSPSNNDQYICTPPSNLGIPPYPSPTPCATGSGATQSANPSYVAPNIYASNSINFYVFPHLNAVLNYYGCWPTAGLLGEEEIIAGTYAAPAYGFASVLGNLVGASYGNNNPLPIPGFNCYAQNSVDSLFALYQVYGLMSVIGVILPILNLLLGISAVFGISDLLGGASDIFGLSRLI